MSIGILFYVDDSVVLGMSVPNVTKLVQICENHSRKWFYNYNISKTIIIPLLKNGIPERRILNPDELHEYLTDDVEQQEKKQQEKKQKKRQKIEKGKESLVKNNRKNKMEKREN